MRILVCGANGQLGRAILAQAPLQGHDAIGLARDGLDITRAEDVAAALDAAGCDLVINTAAYTAVDLAEQEFEAANAVNRNGAACLAEACARRGVPLIHLSTDYVFDGRSSRPYREDDAVAPLSVYGATKEAGERAIRALAPRHVILRVSWLYGPHGRNFVRSIATAALAGKELRVVDDQIGAPTHVNEVARALMDIATRISAGTMAWGTFHYAARGQVSWHGFACEIVALMAKLGHQPVRIVPTRTADNPRPAARPANSRLDCTKFDQLVGTPRAEWTAPLAATLRTILAG